MLRAPRRLPGSPSPQEAPKEAPKRRPEAADDTQEAPRPPRTNQEISDAKCAKTSMCFQQIERDPLFCAGETSMTLTKSAACSQLYVGTDAHTAA